MPKWPVRAENSVPEAQTVCVERFLRDLSNAPSHASVCGGGRHQNRVPVLFYVCFYGNGPLEPRFSTQTLIFCVCRDLGEMCLTYQATWAGVPPPKNRCWSSQKQTENTRKCEQFRAMRPPGARFSQVRFCIMFAIEILER